MQKTVGRPRRKEPKTRAIWCGQISKDDRDFILTALTPAQRYQALIQAARIAAKPRNQPTP